MEAKDTVIKLNRGGILSDIEVEYYNRGAEAQAEISFKAGIREVVEFMGGYDKPFPNQRDWHAKLKEWGVKEA